MWEASTYEKTSKNSAKQCKTVILAPKRPLQLSKFKFFYSKFEFQASCCITNLKYHIYEASAEYGRGEASTDKKTVQNSAKQCKTVQNSDFGAKMTVTALKIQIFNSKFEFQASSCITDLKYHIYEASAGYG